MSTEFALDLRLARRKSGLTQNDCAHLLSVNQSRLSAMESGRSRPSLDQICLLSLIYDRPFESLFSLVLHESRRVLGERLSTLPQERRETAGASNRLYTLDRLRRRVAVKSGHGAA